MKKGFIKKRFSYEVYDCKAAERKLNEWGVQGLDLTELKGAYALFGQADAPMTYCIEFNGDKEHYASADYIRMCADAGWQLAYQTRDLNYFKSKPGEHPIPLHTDGRLEWETCWRDCTRRELLKMIGLPVLWSLYYAFMLCWQGNLINGLRGLFCFNGVLGFLLLVILTIPGWIVRWVRLFRFRKQFRMALERGEEVPEFQPPREGGWRKAGVAWGYLLMVLLVLCGISYIVEMVRMEVPPERYGSLPVITLSDLGMGDAQMQSVGARHLQSVLADWTQYDGYAYGQTQRVELLCDRYVCGTSWTAALVQQMLLMEEGQERNDHQHYGGIALAEAALGFDRAWLYTEENSQGEIFQCLILRQGNIVARIEAPLDFTEKDTLALIWERLRLED